MLLSTGGAADSDFIVLTDGPARLGRISPSGRPQVRALPLRAQAAAVCEGRVYAFSASEVYAVPGEAIERIGSFGGPVREAAPLGGGRIALLIGGTRRDGILRGAGARLWSPPGDMARFAPEVNPLWDPCFVRASPDGTRLLVAVRKSTHFDPVVRLRPFLYRYAHDGIVPVWKGTSFSRPFADVVMADIGDEPGVEACALEVLADRRRRVTIYTWTGTTMQAVAMSPRAPLGWCLQAIGDGALGAFEQRADGFRFLALCLRNKKKQTGVQELECSRVGPVFHSRPAAWTVACTPGGRWLVALETGGRLRAVRLSPGLP